ncbi:MAG: GNAT family N-acetyltransferase [Actinomycetota bacterium]
MDLQIRTISKEEFTSFAVAVGVASSEVPSSDDIERERLLLDPDRCLAAFDGLEIVGTAAAVTMPMAVPGGELEIGFLTAVGVLPTHRRRGVNTMLMRRQLDDVRERGELVEVLFASEGGIYGRYGYGLATFGLSIEIGTARSRFVRGYSKSGEMGLVERDRAVDAILAVNAAMRLVRPGMVGLDEVRLDYDLTHEHGPEKDVPTMFALHEGDDGVDGYVVYKVKHDWPEGFPRSVLTVRDLQATTPGAYADLWRYVLDVDLIERVEAWNRPVDEPLLHLLQEPRRLRATISDNLWVRIADLEGAIRARRYAGDGRVVLQIVDPFCPWNEGRYALEVSAGEAAEAARTNEPADLLCTINEIGAAYLGGTTMRQLHRAGRVEERTPGALARADAMFSWDPAPWSPYEF